MAGDEGFEQALRVFSIVANAPTTLDAAVDPTTPPDPDAPATPLPLDKAALQDISALIVTALDNVTAAQSGLSLDAAALERATTAETDYQDMAATLVSTVNSADVTRLAVEISAYEAQLQASYSAISKIQSLSLLTYL